MSINVKGSQAEAESRQQSAMERGIETAAAGGRPPKQRGSSQTMSVTFERPARLKQIKPLGSGGKKHTPPSTPKSTKVRGSGWMVLKEKKNGDLYLVGPSYPGEGSQCVTWQVHQAAEQILKRHRVEIGQRVPQALFIDMRGSGLLYRKGSPSPSRFVWRRSR